MQLTECIDKGELMELIKQVQLLGCKELDKTHGTARTYRTGGTH